MKAVLVIDMPTDCIKCPLADGYCWNTFPTKGKADGCPLKHPLKYASNDFYIYDTKYLMENLDREFELLKEVKQNDRINADVNY